MAKPVFQLEGTWEEVASRSADLTGRKVRVLVLADKSKNSHRGIAPDRRPSTAASLLRFSGTWAGDDIERCLRAVVKSRSKARF